MQVCTEIKKNTYYDSVALMQITKELKKMQGIKEIIVGMGTELNKELANNLELMDEKLAGISPNDFFISAGFDENCNIDISTIVKKVEELLNKKTDEEEKIYRSTTLEGAVRQLGDANMAVISLPGTYAADEVRRALMKNLNVMLFSDNVSIEQEIELKKLARDRGLLVMGPDCGTAIINGIPLCFANVVRKGNIGIVGASGTGTQEVSVIIDKLGGGVSQVIGTGGRDLKSEVGGIMMLEGFKALIEDSQTEVIVLISKPPAAEVAEKILRLVTTTKKPVVVNFIGGDRIQIENKGAYACVSLEDAAMKAVKLSKGEAVEDFTGFTEPINEIEALVIQEVTRFSEGQKYLRALYTGGTLADEAMKLLAKEDIYTYSNIPLTPEYRLPNIHQSREHTCIDLGDDDFTKGKPHPMIDPAARVERLPKEAADAETAIVLMDFVIGYGSNEDPAEEMLEEIIKAKKRKEASGGYLSIVGYICGTDRDPQGYAKQAEKLEKAGVILMPSNAQAVRFCGKLLERLK